MRYGREISLLDERTFWGSHLTRWPGDVVERAGMSTEDARYLSTVGLPVGVDWTLEMQQPSPGSTVTVHEGLPVLAREEPAAICLDMGTGHVVSLLGGRGPLVVNSSVGLFGRFLMVYQFYRVKVVYLEEKGAESLIEDVYLEMVRDDEPCMRAGSFYWPRIVAQMRQGEL